MVAYGTFGPIARTRITPIQQAPVSESRRANRLPAFGPHPQTLLPRGAPRAGARRVYSITTIILNTMWTGGLMVVMGGPTPVTVAHATGHSPGPRVIS